MYYLVYAEDYHIRPALEYTFTAALKRAKQNPAIVAIERVGEGIIWVKNQKEEK